MLQQMRAEGVAVRRARGVFPSVTYPTHTTILTGALPSRHRIDYNSPFEIAGATGIWYWYANAIKVPTLWDAVREAGLSSANVSWPVSVGAPVDWNLPEIWSLDSKVTAIDTLRNASSPDGLWEEIEREATGRLTDLNFNIDWITRDDRAGDIAAYLLARHQPNLMTVHLIEADHFQHIDGKDGHRVRRALAAADRAISQMVEAAGQAGILDRTAFVVTGDHGFIDLHTRLAPNVWLVEAGLREAERSAGNWRATFHTTGASAFLHLADPSDSEALTIARRALNGLDPEVRSMFQILEREELAQLGASPDAALALSLEPGVTVTSRGNVEAVQKASGANHGFHPGHPEIHTGLLAWGSGIAAGVTLDLTHQTDVAPLIARLLGVSFAAPDGRLHPELLESTSRAATSD
jgi:predicted AlkP superfamily pyrophosphatase or phosphodiesterase